MAEVTMLLFSSKVFFNYNFYYQEMRCYAPLANASRELG